MWEHGCRAHQPAHRPAPGVHVTVRREGCRSLGGDEELTARVVLQGGRVFDAAACLRGPGVQTGTRGAGHAGVSAARPLLAGHVADPAATSSTRFPNGCCTRARCSVREGIP
jgi:hypothetical protein